MNNQVLGVFKTGNKPKIFSAYFTVLKPCHVECTLVDPTKPNTAYTVVTKTYTTNGKHNLDFRLPRTSEFIAFSMKVIGPGSINSYIDFNQLCIEDYKVPKNHYSPKVAAFMELVTEFNDKAGYLETNKTYHIEKNGKVYEIEYLPFIPDDNGGMHPTPARIHNTKDYIQVSAWHFRNKPIDRRDAILCHEVSHNFVNSNPDSEPQADMNGAMLYDQLGWNPDGQGFIDGFEKTFERAETMLDANNPGVARNKVINMRRTKGIINRYRRKRMLTAA